MFIAHAMQGGRSERVGSVQRGDIWKFSDLESCTFILPAEVTKLLFRKSVVDLLFKAGSRLTMQRFPRHPEFVFGGTTSPVIRAR